MYAYHTPQQEDRQEVSHRDLWDGFREGTTAHGVPHVSNAKGVFKKGFWLVISLAACGFLLFHLYTIFQTYFSYNTSVRISIQQQYETLFPTVTMCNLNPIKKSSLYQDEVLETLLQEKTGGGKKRRRKRDGDMDCTGGSGVKFDKYGICYDWLDRNLHKQSVTNCINDFTGGMYQPVNQDIVDFMAQSGLLDTAPSDDYWMYHKNNRWAELIPVPWTNFNPVFRDDSAKAAHPVISDNNLWHSGTDNAHYGVICQKYIECPYPVYTDSSGTTYCWFLPLGETTAVWDDAIVFCNRFSANAVSLFEPQTQGAMDFFLSTPIYSTIPNDGKYWLGIRDSKWQSTGNHAVWTKWDSYGEVDKTAYIDKSLGMNEWHSVRDNDITEQAMIICQVTGLSYNGYVEPTTAEPTTTVETTTTEDPTTMIQPITTVEPTTTEDPTTMVEPTIIVEPITTVETTTEKGTTEREQTTFEQTPEYTTTMTEVTTTETESIKTAAITTPVMSSQPTMTTAFSSIPDRKPLYKDFLLEETVIENIASIPEETKTEMGYQSYEFIVFCQYEGWQCNSSMFYQYYNPVHGNCYLFNSGWDADYPIETAHMTGRRYGLKVILNIGEDDYLTKFGGPSGARIVVHTHSSMPHPEGEGYLAKPGELISVGVKKVVMQRKPYPFGNCTEDEKQFEIDLYAEKFPVAYSRQNCFRTCYQRQVITECGCSDSYVPNSGTALGDMGEVHVCDVNNREEDDCRYLVNRRYAKGELGCSAKCPDPCLEEYFVASTSTATWPSSVHSDSVLENLKDKIPLIYNSNDSQKYLRNLLQIEVFYEDFNYEKIEEIEAYKTSQFASDVGGILGLWIGCSVISIFEFIELGMDIAVLALVKMCCCKRVPSNRQFRATVSPKRKLSLQSVCAEEEGQSPAKLLDKKHRSNKNCDNSRQCSVASSASSGYGDVNSSLETLTDATVEQTIFTSGVLSRPPLQSTYHIGEKREPALTHRPCPGIRTRRSRVSLISIHPASPTDVTFSDKIKWDDNEGEYEDMNRCANSGIIYSPYAQDGASSNRTGKSLVNSRESRSRQLLQKTEKDVTRSTGGTPQRPPDWWYDIDKRPAEYVLSQARKGPRK